MVSRRRPSASDGSRNRRLGARGGDRATVGGMGCGTNGLAHGIPSDRIVWLGLADRLDDDLLFRAPAGGTRSTYTDQQTIVAAIRLVDSLSAFPLRSRLLLLHVLDSPISLA